ncbi:MAG: NADH-ubiquinone oxidoreductase-F iron-sulfur binding region domain-containing protein [Myxococcota bacterium]
MRVCRGTSCELAGAARVATALAADGPVRGAHCLGHCHRSPVALDSEGGVLVDVDPRRVLGRLRERAPLPAPPRIECLASEPILTRRIARGDFSPLGKAQADGAWGVLEAALAGPPEAVLAAVETSGHHGPGDTTAPSGARWRACAATPGPRVAIAAANEGDRSSFIDRVLLERDPHGVLEGLALCAFAVGATRAVVLVRSEYPRALGRMRVAVAEAERAGLLGARLCGRGPPLAVDVVEGVSSIRCTDTALEGEPREPTAAATRPRLPGEVEQALGERPAVVNDVETLVSTPWIVERGADAFAAVGTSASNGTQALCLNAGFAQPGIVEVPFGTKLLDVIQNWGATPCRSDELAGVFTGGPLGSFLPPEACDVVICRETLAERKVRLGRGGLVAVRRHHDLAGLVRHLLSFLADESSERCQPCRTGSSSAHRLAEEDPIGNAAAIRGCLATMRAAGLCAFGLDAPGPIETLLSMLTATGAARA